MTTSRADETCAAPTIERSGALSIMRRFGMGLGDQLLSSLTNFIFVALIARAVTPEEFGAFSVAYVTYTFSLGASRALAGEPLSVRYSSVPLQQWREGVRVAAGTALMTGAVVGLGCVAVGLGVGGTLGTTLTIVGIALPALLVQDAWRYAFFARGRGGAALLNDLMWGVLMLVALGLLMYAGRSSVPWFTISWAAAGCLASTLGLLQLRVYPGGPGEAIRWLGRQRDLAPRFLAEFAVTSGTSSLTLFGIGSLTSLADVGRLRAGGVALGPMTVLFAGAGLMSVPEGVRLLQDSPGRLVRGSRRISLALGVGVLSWGALVFVLPSGIGRDLLGMNWEGARALVIPLSIGAGGSALAFGAMSGLRSLAAARRSLRARYIDASSLVLLSLSGAALGGATGAAWGYAIAGCLRVPIAWWHFSRGLREHGEGAGAAMVVDSISEGSGRRDTLRRERG